MAKLNEPPPAPGESIEARMFTASRAGGTG